MGKNERQGRKEMLFLTLIPSCAFWAFLVAQVVLFIAEMAGDYGPTTYESPISYLVLGVLILWLFISSYAMAANTSGFRKVGEPSVPTLNIKVGRSSVEASTGSEYSSGQQIQLIFNLVIGLVFGVATALFGWLLFILYSKDKFMYKIKLMGIEIDEAEDIIASKSKDIPMIAASFYRMLEYADVYGALGEKKGKAKMLNIAKKLLNLWEIVEAD